jgi:hypothetical protein
VRNLDNANVVYMKIVDTDFCEFDLSAETSDAEGLCVSAEGRRDHCFCTMEDLERQTVEGGLRCDIGTQKA